MDNTNIVEFHNITFCYDADEGEQQPEPAIRDFTFNVKKGEFVAVLGHNGSGKSTVAKLSNSILIPNEGKVLVKGMDTADEDLSYEIRKTVGVVFQNPDNQIVASIVEEDVAFGPENLGLPREEIRKRVDDSLKAVGMYEYRHHEPHKLSGGQKQRVAIAGIIAMRPECIFLDEPTAMLDPKGRKEVMDTVIKLNKEYGMSVVFITHFMEEAVLADRVAVIDNSRLLLEGTPKEVFKQEDLLRSVGLDIPQITNLAREMKKSGVKVDDSILTLNEFVENITALLGDK
ncbi:MAG: energy-coupling factor transporter ATPase [Oscillospiraceae bacterium]|nr:energy-coupling factor transporter ATPase [Oscillospiraceae bacterium]